MLFVYSKFSFASFIRWFPLESSFLSPFELYYHDKIGSRLNLARKYALLFVCTYKLFRKAHGSPIKRCLKISLLQGKDNDNSQLFSGWIPTEEVFLIHCTCLMTPYRVMHAHHILRPPLRWCSLAFFACSLLNYAITKSWITTQSYTWLNVPLVSLFISVLAEDSVPWFNQPVIISWFLQLMNRKRHLMHLKSVKTWAQSLNIDLTF